MTDRLSDTEIATLLAHHRQSCGKCDFGKSCDIYRMAEEIQLLREVHVQAKDAARLYHSRALDAALARLEEPHD